MYSLVTLRLDPARMQLISGFIDTYLDLTELEERAFQEELGRIEPEAQEQVMQIVTSWMRTGIEQGIEQGKREGEVAIVMRLLKRKVGELHPEVEAQVRELQVVRLEELSEALLDFSKVEDLRDWLGNLDSENYI